jgi:NTE family protein
MTGPNRMRLDHRLRQCRPQNFMSEVKKRLGLSLSGGGYRASAFHLGTLKKLQEMNILNKVDVLSTISGGSITGAAWCLHEGDYQSFHDEMIRKITTKNVIGYIFTSWVFIRTLLFLLLFIGGGLWLSFTPYAYLVFPVLILFFLLLFKYQFAIFPVSDVIESAYNSFFYQGRTLKDLKEKPVLAVGSSNLETGRPFTFSRLRMSDSMYSDKGKYNPPIYFKPEQFPVARAVMASSCVPFAFTPVHIDKQFFQDANDYKRVKPVLVDGGVYDNQGIQKITQPGSSYECQVIITSDAGGSFAGEGKYPNAIALLVRTVDLFMYRIKAVQMVQNIYRNVDGAGRPIAYLSLGWRLANIIPGFISNMIKGQVLKEVIDAQGFDSAWVADPAKFTTEIKAHLEQRVDYAAISSRDLSEADWQFACSTGTNLTCLSAKRVDCLIRQAENLTEIQVKLYCPELL